MQSPDDEERKKKINEHNMLMLHKLIEMVQRQTTLNYDDAKQALIEKKGDYMTVIKDAMSCKPKLEKTHKEINVNQETYSQIRKYMDKGAEQYRKKQEYLEFLENRRELLNKKQ